MTFANGELFLSQNFIPIHHEGFQKIDWNLGVGFPRAREVLVFTAPK